MDFTGSPRKEQGYLWMYMVRIHCRDRISRHMEIMIHQLRSGQFRKMAEMDTRSRQNAVDTRWISREEPSPME